MAFNSRQYEFSDVVIMMGLHDVTAITAISYKVSQSKNPYYGKGDKPLCIQRGKKTYSGSMTLSQSEVEALTMGNVDLLDLEFNVVVTYGNPSKGDALVVDELIGVQFTDYSKEMSNAANGNVMEIKIPFTCLDIRKRS
ncbi:MAG: hypothetical protein LUE10_04965 [Alistipes sp.]|nr:hypothetical protein [Alistipes sp.]